MAMLLNWLPLLLRRRRREAMLKLAEAWPVTTARLLPGRVTPRDPLSEAATSLHDSQVESPYFFTVDGSYFGGHLRGAPMSDSEAHRALKLVPEDLPVEVRYDPTYPDHTVVLASDNPGFPIRLWPS